MRVAREERAAARVHCALTIVRSQSVVVGPIKLSVSERTAHRSMPARASVGFCPAIMNCADRGGQQQSRTTQVVASDRKRCAAWVIARRPQRARDHDALATTTHASG